ncbi:MAG: type II secretion system protein [Planctomycetota bacterium]
MRTTNSIAAVRRGFTLVELLVVIAILTVLIGLLFPALIESNIKKNRLFCQNNLRQLGICARGYADDERFFPFAGCDAAPSEHLQVLINNSVKDTYVPDLFVCLGSSMEKKAQADQVTKEFVLTEKNVSYAWLAEESIPDAGASRILAADKTALNHAGSGINVVYFGGNVQFLKMENDNNWEEITGHQLTRGNTNTQ